jgi:hypothetical protein
MQPVEKGRKKQKKKTLILTLGSPPIKGEKKKTLCIFKGWFWEGGHMVLPVLIDRQTNAQTN